MIKGKVQEERRYVDRPSVNYRKLDALNQSMIKVFDDNPVQFFEEFKMGKKRKSRPNTAYIIGDIVDFYLLECMGDEQEFENRFDEKFALFHGNKGTGQVFLLADYLFEETESCTNEKGEVTCSFLERFRAAYNRVRAEDKYKGDKNTLERVMDDFEKNGKEYFQLRLDSVGKTVVDISLVDKAKTVAKNIMNDSFTKHLFQERPPHMEMLTHFPIQWDYKLGDGYIPCKAELDILLVDYDKKIVYPMDLKTTYDNESFDYMYIKNAYYLQNAFYFKAVEAWLKENGMEEFKIAPMDFIVGDTSPNNRRPLIYKTDRKDLVNGTNGFTLNGLKHRGIAELINDIAWAEQNDEWKCSREAFENQGIMNLKIRYE